MSDRNDNSPVSNSAPAESSESTAGSWFRESFSPFRIATLRGLAVLLPPLLTILLFAWAWNTIDHSIIRPAESLSARLIVWRIGDIRDNSDVQQALNDPNNDQYTANTLNGVEAVVTAEREVFQRVGRQWIPANVVSVVDENPGETAPTDARQYYRRFAEITYLERTVVIPFVLIVFLGTMYLFGKLLAAGVGRMFWHFIESMINRLPIIRNVYSSVKQVTDFAFNEKSVGEESTAQFNRVVALQYPREGIWSIGFVTGESILDIQRATGEPMLSVLMPTSPMPATGFTISIPKSQTVELDLTIDQAIQFCVSCGVVVPDHQSPKMMLEAAARNPAGSLPAPAATDYKDSSSSV